MRPVGTGDDLSRAVLDPLALGWLQPLNYFGLLSRARSCPRDRSVASAAWECPRHFKRGLLADFYADLVNHAMSISV